MHDLEEKWKNDNKSKEEYILHIQIWYINLSEAMKGGLTIIFRK